VLAVAMVAVLLLVTGGGVLVGSAVIARHRAQAAADLGALAAASRLASGREAACASADALTGRARARLAECTIDGLDVVVVVDVAVSLGRWGVATARASARAGPV
jgi:secretion/DNA translocation related TadE-like protein